MGKLTAGITMSLDGFVAGPNPSLDDPLGEGGEQLHEWAFATRSFQEMHGREGGETGQDDDVLQEWIAATGVTVMGRRMFSGGEGPWERDPNANGWWGDEPPFHHPVFVLTHHAREPLELEGTTFTFVTEGIESALEQARAAADERDVTVGGGAAAIQQYLQARLLDELEIHVVPLILGAGTRLLENLGDEPPTLECTRAIASTTVTHLRYRVVK